MESKYIISMVNGDIVLELEKEIANLESLLKALREGNEKVNLKPKQHLLDEMIDKFIEGIGGWKNGSYKKHLKRLRYESIKWRHELTDHVNHVDEILKKEGHADWIVEGGE